VENNVNGGCGGDKMSRLLLVLCIFVACITSAHAGELFSCTDRGGNPVITSIPQDGMKNCVRKCSFKDSPTADAAGAGATGAAATGETAGSTTGTDTGTAVATGTADTSPDTTAASTTTGSTADSTSGSKGTAAGTGTTATGQGIAGTSKPTVTPIPANPAGAAGTGATSGSSTAGTKKELR
jgi:hypothetical protein